MSEGLAPPTVGSSRAVAFGCRVACVALLLALAPRRAAAEEPPPTRLEYRVPEGCPPVAEFERRVHLRSARIRFLSAGTAPRTLFVDVAANGAASAGTLRLVESDGTDRRRGFQATSCDDAVDGLALIAAVALDPEGASGLATPAPPSPPPTSPPPPPPTKPAPKALGSETPAIAPVGTLHVQSGSFGGGGTSILGLVPGPVVEAYAFAQLDFEARGWAPALRLSGTILENHDFADSAGSAVFSMVVPRLEVCPLRWGSPKANVRPCVFGSVAIVKSTGSAGAETQVVGIAGVSALGSVRIWGPLAAYGSAGIGLPHHRYEYAFRTHDPAQPSVELYSTKPLVGFLGGGVALEFP